jgi:selenocysteine lyase/cysteine desulfurase
MRAVEAAEDVLFEKLLSGLQETSGVHRYGAPARRTPTALFGVDGVPPQAVYEQLATRGVNAPASSFYALEASRWLGLGDHGAVRAGLAPYTSEDDVDRLLAGVREIAESSR